MMHVIRSMLQWGGGVGMGGVDGGGVGGLGHLFDTTSSFVHHFKAIGEFELEL